MMASQKMKVFWLADFNQKLTTALSFENKNYSSCLFFSYVFSYTRTKHTHTLREDDVRKKENDRFFRVHTLVFRNISE